MKYQILLGVWKIKFLLCHQNKSDMILLYSFQYILPLLHEGHIFLSYDTVLEWLANNKDTKLSSAVDTPEGCDTIQRDQVELENWSHGNLVKFNKIKFKVLHLSQGNPQYQFRLGDEGTEGSPVEKDLRVLVDEKLDMCWQGALARLHQEHLASKLREVILYSLLLWDPIWSTESSSGVSSMGNMWSCKNRSTGRPKISPEERCSITLKKGWESCESPWRL